MVEESKEQRKGGRDDRGEEKWSERGKVGEKTE